MTYAGDTSVTEDRTRAEIERLLMKHGADEFGYNTRRTEAMIGFVLRGIRVEMRLPLPDRDDPKFKLTPTRRHTRSADKANEAWQQEVRQRWRSLCLIIKAKLVAVEEGVTTFETEFLPYMVWGDGQTTAQKLLPMIKKAIENKQPLMLESAS